MTQWATRASMRRVVIEKARVDVIVAQRIQEATAWTDEDMAVEHYRLIDSGWSTIAPPQVAAEKPVMVMTAVERLQAKRRQLLRGR